MDLTREEQLIEKAINYAKEHYNENGTLNRARDAYYNDELFGMVHGSYFKLPGVTAYGYLRINESGAKGLNDPKVPYEDKYVLYIKIIYRDNGDREVRHLVSPEGKVDKDAYDDLLNGLEKNFNEKYHINSDVERNITMNKYDENPNEKSNEYIKYHITSNVENNITDNLKNDDVKEQEEIER